MIKVGPIFVDYNRLHLVSLIPVIILVSDGLSGLGGMTDLGLSPKSGFLFPILGFFCVFLGW
jgi:hypothetical protein